MKIRKNDNVLVIAGKDKGKKGKIRFVFPKKSQIIVEHVNMIKKHTKAKGAVRQAGIIEREAPIHMSNVMLVCNKCSKPTRIGFTFLEDKNKVRICRNCKEVLD